MGNTQNNTWRDMAGCRGTDPEAFYPETGHGSTLSMRQVRAICRQRPVRSDCLQHALTAPEVEGWWGGVSPRARVKMRRAMAAVRSAGGDAGSSSARTYSTNSTRRTPWA
jgi:WhiB family transcriptional regulator, redox-sensing transcriptional regulator